MAQSFSDAQWQKIRTLFKTDGKTFGLPDRRKKSVVIGSFNIRKLGAVAKKSAGSWNMLIDVAERFDLLAIQEVQDDMDGLKYLRDELNKRPGNVRQP